MPLPEWCEGCPPPSPCCTGLYSVAESLLEYAWAAFEQCAPQDCCDTLQRLVAAAEPHMGPQDYLAVWYDSLTLSTPRNAPSQAKGLMTQGPQATFNVKLVETGYPTLEAEGTEIFIPAAYEIEWAAKEFLGHAEAVYIGVLNALFVDNACGQLRAVGPMRSLGPSGGTVGAQFSVTLEVKWQ